MKVYEKAKYKYYGDQSPHSPDAFIEQILASYVIFLTLPSVKELSSHKSCNTFIQYLFSVLNLNCYRTTTSNSS